MTRRAVDRTSMLCIVVLGAEEVGTVARGRSGHVAVAPCFCEEGAAIAVNRKGSRAKIEDTHMATHMVRYDYAPLGWRRTDCRRPLASPP